MCGILFAVSPVGAVAPLEASTPLTALISRRGPDSTHTHTATFKSYSLTFTSSVLSLRGAHVIPQPLVDPSTGSVLCWNGEAWRIGNDALLPGANDGEQVFKLLLAAGAGKELKDALESVAGPYALVYYDAVAGRVWFGRDALGRRSLLYRGLGVGLEKGFVIASVGDGSKEAGWKEVEADGLRYLDLVTGGRAGWVPFMWEDDAAAEGRREFMVNPSPAHPPGVLSQSADGNCAENALPEARYDPYRAIGIAHTRLARGGRAATGAARQHQHACQRHPDARRGHKVGYIVLGWAGLHRDREIGA